MLREIGSNFWIEPKEIEGKVNLITPELFNVYGEDFCWTSTCRSAILLILNNIENQATKKEKIALIPEYTCESVADPFLKAGYKIYTFAVHQNMEFDGAEIKKTIEKVGASVLLFHRYFGFDTLKNSSALQALEDVTIIEDRTQCLYSDYKCLNCDYVVGSIRKWTGVPDGGFVVSKNKKIQNKPVYQDRQLIDKKIDASLLKYDYLYFHNGEKQCFLDKYREAEEALDQQESIFAIGDVSLKIQADEDLNTIKLKRRENYKAVLNSRIGEKALFDQLPDDVVPLYFPIITTERARLQNLLREKAIYAPIIWPQSDVLEDVSDAASLLYKELLCLPIDQRYGMEEMQYMIDVLERCL